MNNVTMKQLLEAGVHFGHPSRRWNPKMKAYIYTERNGIYIVDLKKTLRLLRQATKYVRDVVAEGGTVMFVGTKKQAKDIIAERAESCGMPYVNNRWLGGLMTNFKTVRISVVKLLELERMFGDGSIEKYSKKEQSKMHKEMLALRKNLGGIKHMDRLPDLMFVIDPHKDAIAVQEARKLGIPIVAVVDTNCDPDVIDHVIPGNDDAVRSIKLMVGQMAEACQEGRLVREAQEEQEMAEAAGPEAGMPMSAEELEQHFNVYQQEAAEGSVEGAEVPDTGRPPAADSSPRSEGAPSEGTDANPEVEKE